MFAATEHGVATVVTRDSSTTRAGSALVAGIVGFTEVRAAGALHEVAAHRGHVTELRRRARQERLTEHRVTLNDQGMVGERAVADQRPDPHALAQRRDFAQRQTV